MLSILMRIDMLRAARTALNELVRGRSADAARKLERTKVKRRPIAEILFLSGVHAIM